ncbi:stachyose synthase [Amborella trichopoda]|uniref:Galactinol--sucrose galactosyltransferase n=1 Tax=Amborella trichopoda TaxID=13333 RepID=W1NZV1_AMBTC|nr:stachyose synthase [Amborella trichopoda]ERN03132.1 hypothetical protein AMTR_s00003p00091000 [Amborella trichopoda]|eukprot:XP_006841457.1 stachyose synthase [Amborella trichopoda]
MAPNPISNNSNNTPIVSNTHFSLSNGSLCFNGVTLLSEVPDSVTLRSFFSVCTPLSKDTPVSLLESVESKAHCGAFLGFEASETSDTFTNPLGKFINRRFLSIFRFKTWWSTMWIGNNGSDLQKETQLVLFEIPERKRYCLVLPLIEENFRFSLQPGHEGKVVLWGESGSTMVQTSSFMACVYLHIGINPFDLMREAFSAMRVHLGSFKLLSEKKLPNIIDRFGWCTWDAFYLTVEPVGVWHGVKEFFDGGLPLRFLIIDDGWQSVNTDKDNPLKDAENLVLLGSQMQCRLYRLKENDKFGKYKKGNMLRPDAPAFDEKRMKEKIEEAIEMEKERKRKEKWGDWAWIWKLGRRREKKELSSGEVMNGLEGEEEKGEGGDGEEREGEIGLKAFLEDLRERYTEIDDVYVWHALCGAWGGVRPGTTHLKSEITPAVVSPGLDETMHDLAVVKVVEGGIGLVDPSHAEDFYDSMHSYLSKSGITGVKVDVIHTLEYVAEEYGGRVQLAKAYYDGLSKSLEKNFSGGGLIASMEQCNDFFYLGTRQISMGRVGDDFWFEDPNGDPMGVYWLQGVHMVHCSYNSLWMGQFIQPDWDMFQSDHVCARFHGASRSICGGPIYVSDKIGGHDFELLRKLVLPDGTILRCIHYALPTRDCLFENPLFDGKTALKIWNLNKCGGVIGAFNCQGAGWCPKEHKSKAYPQCYKAIASSISSDDIEWEQRPETFHMRESDEFAVYHCEEDELQIVSSKSSIGFTLKESTFEIFTMAPVQKLGSSTKFAAIGLTNMFNSGGAIEELKCETDDEGSGVRIGIKGAGRFTAYSSERPKGCILNGKEREFVWDSESGRLWFEVPWIGGASSTAIVQF